MIRRAGSLIVVLLVSTTGLMLTANALASGTGT